MHAKKTQAFLTAFTLIVGVGAVSAQTEKRATEKPTSKQEAKAAAASQLPVAIGEAFKKTYPGATIRSASKESQNGKVVWEVESIDQGRRRDLIYSLDGTALEIEEQIDAAEIPLPVAAGLKQLHPRATIAKAEKVTRGQTVEYELTLKGATKSTASFTPDGQPVPVEPPKPKK